MAPMATPTPAGSRRLLDRYTCEEASPYCTVSLPILLAVVAAAAAVLGVVFSSDHRLFATIRVSAPVPCQWAGGGVLEPLGVRAFFFLFFFSPVRAALVHHSCIFARFKSKLNRLHTTPGRQLCTARQQLHTQPHRPYSVRRRTYSSSAENSW